MFLFLPKHGHFTLLKLFLGRTMVEGNENTFKSEFLFHFDFRNFS